MQNSLILEELAKLCGGDCSDEIAQSIALANFPWPDEELTQEAVAELLAELLPQHNLCHFSILEIAADRLYRLADSARNKELNQLAKRYTAAAKLLAEQTASDACPAHAAPSIEQPVTVFSNNVKDVAISADLVDLINLAEHRKQLEESGQETNAYRPGGQLFKSLQGLTPIEVSMSFTIAQLIGAESMSETPDIGELLGGSKTGLAVDDLIQLFQVKTPGQYFDEFIETLDTRDRDIFLSRICSPINPKTLENLAETWGISRERVRQREKKVISSASDLKKIFKYLTSMISKKFQGKVVEREHVFEATGRLSNASKWPKSMQGFSIYITGPWKLDQKWVIHEDARPLSDEIESRFQSLRGNRQYVVRDDFEDLIGNLFVTSSDGLGFLKEKHNLVVVGKLLTKKNDRSLVATALRNFGQPATKEEIAEILDISPKQVGSILSSLNGVVRADIIRWGYAEWIDDEYTGIVEEIIQRIEEEGGEVSMFRLVTELPEMFGVSEASVRAYISSNAFEVENGYVRQADTSKFSPKDPRSIRGAFESNGRWSQMIKLNDNHFNGYSLGVTFDLAFANGIRPNDELAVPILGGDDQGTIIWRPTSLNRLVDVGRISKSLRTLGFRPGDYTLIEITRESIYLGSPSQEQMLSETYPDDDGDDLIFDGSFNENLMSESSVLERKSR